MAIDQTPSTLPPESSALPAIENEFPTYRAISSTAVLSLVFGVASVFCFADLWFLLLSGVAVAFGLYSLRKIRQLPDVLTGVGLARVGIGVAVLFGATALTRTITEEVTIRLDAGKFARRYVAVLKDEPVSVALWYQQSPAYRKEKGPDELVEELKKQKNPTQADPYRENSRPVVKIKERLEGGKGEIRYSQIESRFIDGLTVYANALLEVDGPVTKEFPEKESYVLLQMMKGPDAGPSDWVVREIKYPYTPRSVIAESDKKDDDGHGHAGSH